MPSLPRFVVNESNGAGASRDEAEEASSSESEQDEEADVTDAEEEQEEDGSDAEEPQREDGAHSGRQTALPRAVPAEETPRAKLNFKLKKQRTSDEVCHVRVRRARWIGRHLLMSCCCQPTHSKPASVK